MKRNSFRLAVFFILTLVVSCDEPETVVTNIVHPDGSMTRKIEMKNSKNNFSVKSLKVPFDNTWTIKDSLEVSKNGDTTWVKRAEKVFKNTDEINLAYKSDTGANKNVTRHTSFEKRFRWFNTEYRFSEVIDKSYSDGYPVKDFLNSEELLFFYSPQSVTDAALKGSDSTRYKILKDSVDAKSEKWMARNLVSAWIGEFSRLTEKKEGSRTVVNSLKSNEKVLADFILKYQDKFDSLWENGVILKQYLGEENYNKFKIETDSASGKALGLVFVDFKDYSVRIAMPGSLTGTNGFIDSSRVLLWPVKSDYFMTENYEMWAESKTRNMWAWVVSGLFLMFVISGIIIKRIKKAE